ncbi:MAG: S41 family peptidase, partial [Chloroflexota bacterium]
LALSAIPGILFGIFLWRFIPRIPAADFPAPQNQVEAREQDLEYLLNITSIDHSFSEEAEKEFLSQVEELGKNMADMSDAEFALHIAAAGALADNGHTNVRIASLADQFNSLPLRFFWFEDGLYIVRAHAEFSELIGAQVVAYDGVAPETLVPQLARYTGGKEVDARFYSPYFLGSPGLMHGAGLVTNPDQVSFILRLSGGETQEVTIQIEEKQTETLHGVRHPIAKNFEAETNSGNDWVYLDAESVTKTHYGMRPEEDFWTDELPNSGYYVRMRWSASSEDPVLSQWLADIGKELKEAPADYLVIDLRSNPGGDYTQTMRFARSVTELVKPDGRVYTLTDHGTFSAALVTTAFIKDAAGEQGQIVGSEVGDREQFWAEGGRSMTLPNSSVRVSVSTGYHDWENGCTDWSRCFWVNILFGAAVGKLDPDIIAPVTFADYSQGIDTTLQAVFEAEENYSR